MEFVLLFSVLLLLLRPVSSTQDQGTKLDRERLTKTPSPWPASKLQLFRSKRSAVHIKITECVYATSEEAFYYFEAEEASDQVCGIYLFADASKVIEVQMEYLNVPCGNGGLVTFFDGWELGGKFFPGIDDHEKLFRQRHEESCGVAVTKKLFVTSQNAGMVHYRIPIEGGGFGFRLKFVENPTPCNILVDSKEDVYTLRNHGRANNCTLMAVFPAKIRILALDVGVLGFPLAETGTNVQCAGQKFSDEVQIGGSKDLDSSGLFLFRDFCGADSSPGASPVVIRCEVSIVRLLSSGLHDNSVILSVEQPEEVEFFESTNTCE